MAAEQGNAEAQILMGFAYYWGKGVAKDDREAVRWYRMAAEQGEAYAQYNLGISYANGRGVAKDDREAVRWYRMAAEQRDAGAQFILGNSYANGEGVAKDDREAVRWFRMAADLGHAKAQYNLGISYANGRGVAKDDREAVRWHRMAAEQGDAEAQFILGNAYRNGKGVAKDRREAVRWYRMAAEQGYAAAQNNLGASYLLGEGVVEDDREAYIWLSIARASGNELAADLMLKVSDFLSQTEIRSAQQEAARRMETIENRSQAPEEPPDIGAMLATSRPKTTNIAAGVFENIWRSVVVIINDDGQGGGVIIRPNIVATNCHVVDAGGGIKVYKANNRRADTDTAFTATIRRADRDKDFCLLDVANLWGIPAAVRQYDTLKVGEEVYGLGAPRGLDLSLSDGLISQLRKLNGQRVIQTNAAISPGSSGGGLFDTEGNLIGILTSKIADKSTEGIGFAIAADLALAH